MEKHLKTPPYGGKSLLESAVRRAIRAQNGDFGSDGCKRFETTFAEELAKLIELYGLGPTMRSLVKYESRIGLPSDLSFLGEPWGWNFPDSVGEVDGFVETVVLDSPNIELYISAQSETLSDEYSVRVTDDVTARIPLWEATTVVARNRDQVEASRQEAIEGMGVLYL